MPEFTYTALANSGARNVGTLTAQSEREAMSMLDARGLYPIQIQVAKSAITGKTGGAWARKIKSRVMATFYAQLADLLHAGVPLLRSLEILERQSAAPALSEVLREVKAKVSDGTSLAESMAQHPRAFNELAISMVRAGQEGGFLEDVLKRIAEFTEHQEDLKSKVVGAMAYPVFLAVVGVTILLGLVIFLVPKFEPLFKKLKDKGDLPALTEYLIATSNFLWSYGWAPVIGMAAAVYAYRKWAATEAGRLRVDAFRLRLPIFGRIYNSLALSRFTRILGTMLRNGIPILTALRIAKDSTGNKVLANAIERSAENIKAGDKLASPLMNSKHFPRDVVEMIAVGEESNNLDNVLVSVADALEKRTTRQLDISVRLLEPIMLLVMAGFTLIVVLGLLLPVFKFGSAAKG